MAALSSRFLALAALCALAVLPGSTAEARAITYPGHEAAMLTSSPSGIIAGRSQKAETIPVLPLPDSLYSGSSSKPSSDTHLSTKVRAAKPASLSKSGGSKPPTSSAATVCV